MPPSSATTLEPQTRKIPAAAFEFDLGPLQFAEVQGEPVANRQPIACVARSAQPIEHWYWGRIVHDMAGMKLRKPKAPLDWCHWDEVNLGYLDKFEASPEKGLVVSGEIISVFAEDKADEVIRRGRAGVPYEASLDWSGPGCRIEEIGENVTVQVNGYAFQGPGYVVREWPLAGVAVCPFGADHNTETKFADKRKPRGDLEVTIFSAKENPMSTAAAAPAADPKQQTAPAGAPPATPPSAPAAAPAGDDGRAQFTAQLKRFTDAFGGEDGAKWFGENKTFEQGLELQVKKLTDAAAAKDQRIAELENKFKALNLGETAPVPSGDADAGAGSAGQPANKFTGKLSDGLSRFAAGIVLPGKK